MNTFFTFCILITLLNDIFEFNCQDMLAATCDSRLAPVSTELIFIKDVVLPGWFMKFAWSLLSFFTAATIVKAVAMAVILVSIAVVALFYHLKPLKPLVIKYVESRDDLIQMIDISIAHVCVNKKPFPRSALENEPVEPKETLAFVSAPIESSPYLVNVGDLFPELSQVTTMPARRMSYADAVGYEQIEIHKPRNPNVLGYDVYIADLFPDEVVHSAYVPVDESLKSEVITSRRFSYADAVGYEHMEMRKPRNPNVLGYDVYLGDLFPDVPAEELQKSNPINYICIETPPVPVHRLSYAEAVGYEFMEVRKPKKHDVLGYDVYIADFFEVEDVPFFTKPNYDEECIHKLPDSLALYQAPARRLSYADAVGYECMETRRPRYSHAIESSAYLGDLFTNYILEASDTTEFNFDAKPVENHENYLIKII